MRSVAVLVQLLGILLCFAFFPLGIIAGLILILGGGIIYRRETARIKEARNTRQCPFCAERIKSEAVVCKHCSRELPGSSAPIQEPLPPAKSPEIEVRNGKECVSFSCPECNETVSFPSKHAGMVKRCPKCDERLVIPEVTT